MEGSVSSPFRKSPHEPTVNSPRRALRRAPAVPLFVHNLRPKLSQ